MAFEDFYNQTQQAQQSQQPTAAPSPGGGGFDSFYSSVNGGAPDNSQWSLPSYGSAAPAPTMMQQVMAATKPTSITDSVGDGQQSGWKELGDFGMNAVKDVGSTVAGIGNMIMHPVTTIKALPQVAKTTGSGLSNWFQQLGTDPNAALYTLGNSVFEHPLSSLLMATGVGDAVGAGAKIAGAVGDRAALSAATTAAELTPEEAATASLAQPSKLGAIGDQISSGSNILNPANAALKGATAVKDSLGTGLSKLLSLLNGTGSDGATALQNIASGPGTPIGAAAIQGMRTGGNDIAKEAMTNAIGGTNKAGEVVPGTINEQLANNGNAGLINMAPIQQATQAALQEFGMNPQIATPEEMQAINNYLEMHGNLGDVKNMPGATDYMDAANKAMPIYNKYNLGPQINDIETQVRNGLNANRYKVTNNGPSTDQITSALQDLSNKNGFVGIAPGISSIPKSVQTGINDLVENIYRTGGGAGGYEASANNLQKLKNLAGSYFNDSPVASSEQRAGNAVVTQIKNTIDQTLKQYPEYQDANKLYQAGYGGQKMAPVLPTSNYLKGGDAVAAYLLSHFVNPAAAAGIAVTSPRIAGEAANLYGNAARVYGTATLPATAAAQSPSIMALLNLIGQGQQPQLQPQN